jgi:Transposase DDE domain
MDTDTFLTILYVMIDDFDQAQVPPEPPRRGPAASLSRSEVVTLALFGQWACFPSERAFYRYAWRHLRGAFPQLPARTQFNRLQRHHRDAIVAFALSVAQGLLQPTDAYEALDSAAVPTRDAKRRGRGWLAGQADIGWSNRLGWYEGFHLLVAATPGGLITGFGFAPASTKDQPLAETFFATRQQPHLRLPSSGESVCGVYVVDTGFEGRAWHQHWWADYGIQVIGRPRRTSRHPWPKPLRRWLAGLRQMVETVFEKLDNLFRLAKERPHALAGFQARLAAKVALHNFCFWLNHHLGRPSLACADLLEW